MEQGEDMNSCSSVSGKKGGKRLVLQVEQRKDLIEVDDEDVAFLGMQTTPETKLTETDNVDHSVDVHFHLDQIENEDL